MASNLAGIVHAECNMSECNCTAYLAQKGIGPVSGTLAMVALIGALSIIVIIAGFASNQYRKGAPPGKLRDVFYAEDGYPSLSRFQFLLWTFLIAVGFTWIWLIRILGGALEAPDLDIIPANILVLMGISVAVPIASSAISSVKYKPASSKDGNNQIKKKDFCTIIQENNRPSLTRLQMLMWTVIGLVLYSIIIIFTVIKGLEAPSALVLPNIDPTIVVLMGLSQGSYIGGKLTASGPAIQITEVHPKTVQKGQPISIIGTNFGNDIGKVYIGDQSVVKDEIEWSEGQIDVKVPAGLNPGKHTIRIAQGGKLSNEEVVEVTG